MTALEISLIMLFAGATWWASTGLILRLIAFGESSWRWSMLAGVLAGGLALYCIVATSQSATREGAVAAFLAAIVLWGVVEMAFLMGYVVGPRCEPCPPGVTGLQRFRFSAAALAYHEIALAGILLMLAWLLYGAANPLALHLFALLWVMRLSAKLNIFLGVSNANESYLPARIAYLATYFRRAPVNWLFPVSISAATTTVVMLTGFAMRPEANAHEVTSAVLLATFAALAVIEHWMLILPVPSMALWPWARESVGREPAVGARPVAAKPIAAKHAGHEHENHNQQQNSHDVKPRGGSHELRSTLRTVSEYVA